jgi:hypothetical protein
MPRGRAAYFSSQRLVQGLRGEGFLNARSRVRHGFEQDEIDGFHGSLDTEPEQVWTHDDAEAKRTLLTLAIGVTLKPER